MDIDPWLPIGHLLPDGTIARGTLFAGADWQILRTQKDDRALIAKDSLARRWISSGLIDDASLAQLRFGDQTLVCLSSSTNHTLAPVAECKSPSTKSEALAFALALRATRAIDPETPLQDALYVEKLGRILPTYSLTSKTDDDVILGYWLTGGAPTSAKSFRRLSQMLSWMPPSHLSEVVRAAGISVQEVLPTTSANRTRPATATSRSLGRATDADGTPRLFSLPGRSQLEGFFREHIIDIVQNRDRYSALGIEFPSAVVLHGPPGTGKTFAVEKLVEFLGWPSFQVDASSIASPYIHETSRKVSEIFETAIENAPSVLVIDEMEAFLSDREMGVGHHRVEEVAEFLRRIPDATKKEVLIVAMTNRIEMIDGAILRRGRFDHIIEVGFANYEEILSLLQTLLAGITTANDVDPKPLAKRLEGRPLSDVAFVVREGARLAARAGGNVLTQECLLSALAQAPALSDSSPRRIGFV